MSEKRMSIFNWNHVSKELEEDEVEELKSYYKTYHKKFWAYKQAHKRFRRMKFAGNILTIVFATGGIASTAATGGIALIAISGVSVFIKAWMDYQGFDLKIHNCVYAYQSYGHILTMIKEAMRSGHFDRNNLIATMTNVDNYVIDNTPSVDKYFKKYNKTFAVE